MTAEQLRDAYIRDIDDALDSWVLMRRLSEEQKRRLRAQRAFLIAASTDTLAALMQAYNREPIRSPRDNPSLPTDDKEVDPMKKSMSVEDVIEDPLKPGDK